MKMTVGYLRDCLDMSYFFDVFCYWVVCDGSIPCLFGLVWPRVCPVPGFHSLYCLFTGCLFTGCLFIGIGLVWFVWKPGFELKIFQKYTFIFCCFTLDNLGYPRNYRKHSVYWGRRFESCFYCLFGFCPADVHYHVLDGRPWHIINHI